MPTAAPGSPIFWIDDLELVGQVPAARFASTDRDSPGPRAARRARSGGLVGPAGRGEAVQLNGTVLLVAGRPFFPRAIESNGEPFEWLHSLGFNAVRLPAAPTVVQLREAERLGLWLIAPPPDDGVITPNHDRVMAWDLGSRLADERLELTRQRAAQLRRADLRPNRPVVGEAVERLWSYSRVLNILVLRRSPLGGVCRCPTMGDGCRPVPPPRGRALRSGPRSKPSRRWNWSSNGPPWDSARRLG